MTWFDSSSQSSNERAGHAWPNHVKPALPLVVDGLAAEAVAVGGLFTLILALRSRVAYDFIYFQF